MLIETIRKNLAIFLASFMLFCSLSVWQSSHFSAVAHRPHDVITQVKTSADFAQDQHVYTITRGNFFWSDNGGESWHRVEKGLAGLNIQAQFTSLAISPQNQQTFYMTSSGEGLFKSTDEGLTWSAINQGLDTQNLSGIFVRPDNDAVLYATGTEGGLYRSDNAGQQWSKIIADTVVTQIAFPPNTPSAVMMGDHQGALWVSTDQGTSWQNLHQFERRDAITAIGYSQQFATDQTFWVGTETAGLWRGNTQDNTLQTSHQGINDQRIRDIAVVPGDSKEQTLLVSTWSEAVYISQDGGDTWRLKSAGVTKSGQADELKLPHFGPLEISGQFAQDQTLFLSGFNGLFKSTDGGESWQEIDTLSGSTIVALAISPNYQADGTVAAVSYVGLPYLTTDQGKTWQAGRKGLEIPRFTSHFRDVPANHDPRRFFDVVFSPNFEQDQTLFASLLWSKIVRSTNGGKSWQIIQLPQEDRGITLATSPDFAADQTLYLAAQSGRIYRSQNRGKSLTKISQLPRISGNSSPSLVLSPQFAQDRTLYAASSKGIHRSQDAGKTWQLTTAGNQLASHYIQLAISANFAADQTLYAGTNRGIYQTTNGGETWEKLVPQGSLEDSDYVVEAIALSPNYAADQTVLISVRGAGLLKSVDQGKTFTSIGDDTVVIGRMRNVPSSGIALQFSPNFAQDQTIYGFGSAELEVFKSNDAGTTWTRLPIPYQAYNHYDWGTSGQLFLTVHRRRIVQGFVVAVIMAGFIYAFYVIARKYFFV